MSGSNRMIDRLNEKSLPRHIGIIMDGNGRWAKKRGLPRLVGHKEGAETFRRIAEHLLDLNIEVATFYAFSTENWKRPKDEVDHIFGLLNDYLEDFIKSNKEKKLRLSFIGDRTPFSSKIRDLMERAEKETAAYSNCINLALNYGSRDELLRAFQLLAAEGKTAIDHEDLAGKLYTAGQPDVDLLIRTGGEKRLSNFLLYQAAYAELYFTDKLWPDMSNDDIDDAIEFFATRERRFGGVIERKS